MASVKILKLLRLFAVSGMVSVAVSGAGTSAVLALGERDCARLSIEKDKLSAAGVQGHLEKGPDWARANLTPEQINTVKRYLAMQEDIEFKCDAAAFEKVKARIQSGGDFWDNLTPPLPARKPLFSAAAKGRLPVNGDAAAAPQNAVSGIPLPVRVGKSKDHPGN